MGIYPGDKLFWKVEKFPVKAIIVHHTAGLISEDPKKTIQAIYEYHARVRGWGDIGYNILIDQFGNIYEGRRGGIFSEGAHAYGFNSGSIGISLIGNFEEIEVPEAQMKSFENVIGLISREMGLNVSERISWNGKEIFVLSGHIDVGATLCPGKNFYPGLKRIRDEFSGKGFIKGNLPHKKVAKVQLFEKSRQILRVQNLSQVSWVKNTDSEVFLDTFFLREFGTEKFLENFDIRQIQDVVNPNEFAEFEISTKGIPSVGKFFFPFRLKNKSGETIFLNSMEFFEVEVLKPKAKLLSVEVSPKKDFYRPFEEVEIIARYKNENSFVLNENVFLGTFSPKDSESKLFHETWFSKNRPARIDKESLPNEIFEFRFKIRIPDEERVEQKFLPVMEWVSWFDESLTEPVVVSFLVENRNRKKALNGFFYSDGNFSEHFSTATDIDLNITWDEKNPSHWLLSGKKFSARIFGFLDVPESGEYEFELDSVGDVKVFLDGEILISSSGRHKKVTLEPGKKKILVEFVSLDRGEGKINIFWKKPSSEKMELVDRKILSQYENLKLGFLTRSFFEGRDFSANFAAAKKSETLNLPKTFYTQHLFARADDFIVQQTFYLNIEKAGEYEFLVEADDGIKVWIDDPLVISSWGPYLGKPTQKKYFLEQGIHFVVVNYREDKGESFLDFKVKFPGDDNFREIPRNLIYSFNFEDDPLFKKGFSACFFQDEKGKEKLLDRNLKYCETFLGSFDYGFGGPKNLKEDYFSIKIKGVLEGEGREEFVFGSDDGFRIFTDDGIFEKKNFRPKSFSKESFFLDFLRSGRNIEFDYFEEEGLARIFVEMPFFVFSR